MNGSILIAAASLWLADPAAQDGHKSFQLTPEGRWEQLQAPPQPSIATPTAGATQGGDADLARIEDLLKQSRYAQARSEGVAWLKANASSPAYDRGLYLVAQSLRGVRDYIRAFYYCDELLDEHGDSPLYQDALQLQYAIADAYLLGAKDRLVGLRIIGRQDEAVEMLFRIQQRAPGSPTAEKALLRTADYYWASGDFDLATDTYHSYVQSYPRSPLVPQARLREAYTNLAQFHGPTFDSTSLLNAKALLRQIAADYPELAKQENVADKLALADRQLARKLYLNAEFYRRTGQPVAASKLCKRLLSLYPDVPEAADARKLLDKLEPHVR